MRILKPLFYFSLKNTRLLHSNSNSLLKMSTTNVLLENWQTPFSVPPFNLIKPHDFAPAFEVAMADHLHEVSSLVESSEPPCFENTIAAIDRAGGLLTRTQKVFYNLCSSCSSPELQEVQLKLAGPLAAHSSSIYTLPGLFKRVDSVYINRETLLDPEKIRLVERLHLDFTRAGKCL